MADRPLDCSECKKSITVQYTEIVGDKMNRTVMCASCPHLEKRLYGKAAKAGEVSASSLEGSLVCGGCGTTLDSIRMGHHLGCAECYDVFSNVIIDELIKEHQISRHFTANHRTQPLHMGQTPGAVTEISPTMRLIALNEALDETLIREDYEQAALLRDQIEKLKEHEKNKT